MPTPNSPPNETSGSKSLAALLWQSRRHTADKSKKDWWDKADIVAKWLIAFVTAIAAGIIAVIVAIIGGNIQQAVTTQTGKIQASIAEQNTGKDYVQLALNILAKKDLPDEMQKNKGLRKWAVDLLNHYSQVKLTDATSDQLINGETIIPFVSSTGPGRDVDAFEEFLIGNAPQALNRHRTVLAFVTSLGLVNIQMKANLKSLFFVGQPLTISTSIKSPRGILFSPDEWQLVAFNEYSFAVLSAEHGKYFNELIPLYSLRKEVSPPRGILKITFSDDSNTIVVTGIDMGQTRYDLDGNEIK
jgi:hypothetical protein